MPSWAEFFAGPYEIQYDEEWLAITRKFNSVFPITRMPFTMWLVHIMSFFISRDEQLDTQDDRQWVRSKLNARGAKLFDFVQIARSFDPSNPIPNPSITAHCRNPQTESFLQLLDLPYLLDSSNSQGVDRNESSSQTGHPLEDDDIELPDEVEDPAEDDV